MTATIVRLLPERRQMPTMLAKHLTGHHAQGAAPGGILGRMQSESAVRTFVRGLARRSPLSDRPGADDVWQMAEDVVAMVPTMASSISELETFTQGVKSVMLARRRGRTLVITTGRLRTCEVEIVAYGEILRLKIHGEETSRIITARLHGAHASRMDDTVTGA